MDLYLTENGDLAVASNGDVAMTDTQWRDYVQQAYLRLMTAIGDFTIYPTLGADLERLVGMPQSKETGDYGIALINSALTRNGSNLASLPITVQAIPVSMQAIRFDVYITAGSRTEMIISIEQNLGLD